MWESGRAVLSPDASAAEWVALCAAYGEAHLPDLDGLDRFNELAGRVVDERLALGCAALRRLALARRPPAPIAPRPGPSTCVNALRELRGALHGGAVLAAGLTGQEALAFRAPADGRHLRLGPRGPPRRPRSVKERWKIAEAGTDAAFGLALATLDDAERAEFVELVNAVHAGWQSAKEA